MRWIAREPGRFRFAVVLFWPLLGAAIFFSRGESTHDSLAKQIVSDLLLLALTVVLGALTAYLFITRAALAGGVLTLSALKRRDRLRVPFEQVVGYHMDKAGRWWVHTRAEGTTCTDVAEKTRVVVSEPWELHRAFVELAPKRLGGRHWRFPGEPPAEEFRGLWIFDVEKFAGRALPQLAGVMTAILIGYLVTHRRNVGAVGQPLALLLIPAVELWERLDVTNEGIVRHTPLRRKTIRWSEAKAIFREGSPSTRSFVIVGPEGAIHIPAHLACDFDLMKKVLYSLPDPILCVNFDEGTKRGYHVKKRKEAVQVEESLRALSV